MSLKKSRREMEIMVEVDPLQALELVQESKDHFLTAHIRNRAFDIAVQGHEDGKEVMYALLT